MRRTVTPELVDQPSPNPALLAQSLGDLAWLNRYLGGTATVIHQLNRLLGGAFPQNLRVLDVGAGGADIVVALDEWSRRRGIHLEAVALDSGRETTKQAARNIEHSGIEGLRVTCGDARALPFASRTFDVAISSTFLHHLDEGDAVVTLKEMARVSGIGIIVSDLRRELWGYIGAWALANTVWLRHRYTHHDATASMRAAFSLKEALSLAKRARLAAVVEPQLWFRWALRWRRSD
jgi:2-polyprenyl-3-methyl-5-hydroxy-6-metoxy-1,4-benzoquinol methylase